MPLGIAKDYQIIYYIHQKNCVYTATTKNRGADLCLCSRAISMPEILSSWIMVSVLARLDLSWVCWAVFAACVAGLSGVASVLFIRAQARLRQHGETLLCRQARGNLQHLCLVSGLGGQLLIYQ